MVVGPLSTDPGPDPVTVPGAAQGVDRGPGAVIGHVPMVRHAGPPLDLHQGATADPLPAPVPDPAQAPVPGPAPAQPGPPINDRRALRRHHRQATPARISEAPSLGRTSSEQEETLHHR
ncbi:tetra-peptide repeat homeobox protein 1-like [Dermacentor silvarum]|uniref:tetra-peptide repeat homeobox protein 1-like n=1 Tax=Dermacentor silvarum TaxID=543639 RepID=UPI0018978D21|nr:tetra-peptide repeat homeobox protein 1-like [Dermacentor silvarum]